jgi:hypothetical protein
MNSLNPGTLLSYMFFQWVIPTEEAPAFHPTSAYLVSCKLVIYPPYDPPKIPILFESTKSKDSKYFFA